MEPRTASLCRVARMIGGVLFAIVVAVAGPAAAGDLARPEVIGFSADGRYVALEEYGAQDGSGFPFASIFVIDVAANDWVGGSPVRVTLDYDDLPDLETIDDGISRARAQALTQAQRWANENPFLPINSTKISFRHPLDLNY